MIGLNGLNSTCAVSEILKGLFNDSEFNCYHDNLTGRTFLGFGDNSSYLEFGSWGYVNAIIYLSMYDGGMSLGNFSFLQDSNIVDELNLLLGNFGGLGVLNILDCYLLEELYSFPPAKKILDYGTNLLVGIIGSELVEAGVLVIGGTLLAGTPVGWSLLIGGALIVGGSALIAYSDGLFDHPTSLNSWIFVAGDIVISAAGGAYAHTVLKFGVDTGDLVLDLIYGTLEISLSETFKYIISNFHNV